ncbi:unnamed protein product, partial [Polarella glacialis]
MSSAPLVESTDGPAGEIAFQLESIPGLRENLGLLQAQELALAEVLAAAGQADFFSSWAAPGEKDAEKHDFFRQ